MTATLSSTSARSTRLNGGCESTDGNEQKWLSTGIILCALILVLYLPFAAVYWLSRKAKSIKIVKGPTLLDALIKDVANLSDKGIVFLGICLLRNHQTFTASFTAPTVQHLQGRGMVMVGGLTGYQDSFPYKIPGPFWEHLKKNASKLGWVEQLKAMPSHQVDRLWHDLTKSGFSLDF